MNIREMRHEQKGGCILRETILVKLLGVDLTYLFTELAELGLDL